MCIRDRNRTHAHDPERAIEKRWQRTNPCEAVLLLGSINGPNISVFYCSLILTATEPFPKQAASLRIRALARGRDGTLWVGTLGGLFQMEPTAHVIQKTRDTKGGVLSLRIDSRGRLWMGTLADGLFLRSADGTISRGGSPKELASNVVLSVMEDLSQDLWVGTPAGLTRFSETGMRLIRIPGAMDSEFGSVAVDTDRSLWVCSKNLMHLKNGTVQHSNLLPISGVTARSVMRERSGAFWVGTMGSGAYRLAPNHEISHYTSAIGTNYIRAFLETREDGVWIASEGGVANWQRGKLTSFQNTSGAPHAAVLAMAEGRPHELWIGTYRGLSLLRNGQFVSSPAAAALGTRMVWALHVSDNDTLWIGTESGLFRWKNHR